MTATAWREDYRSWGGVASDARHLVLRPADPEAAARALADGGDGAADGGAPLPALAWGCGRSYGDVALNPGGRLLDCRGLDRFVAFDRETGVLTCEAGVRLADILAVACRPEADGGGWFLPVTPGTRFVTVGGAIANDVHGKNHHRAGTFGRHLLSFELARSDGARMTCSPTENAADVRRHDRRARPHRPGAAGDAAPAARRGAGAGGGGHPLRLARRLLRPGGRVRRGVGIHGGLDRLPRRRRAASAAASSRGRGTPRVSAPRRPSGSRASACRRRRPGRWSPACPCAPSTTCTGAGWVRAACACGASPTTRPCFYPLDAIGRWNRLYGPGGFYQFQCVVPPRDGPRGHGGAAPGDHRVGRRVDAQRAQGVRRPPFARPAVLPDAGRDPGARLPQPRRGHAAAARAARGDRLRGRRAPLSGEGQPDVIGRPSGAAIRASANSCP